jgi:hypothetical protein
MRFTGMIAVFASLSLAGCAAYGGAKLLPVPMQVSAPRGTTVRSAVAIETSTGVRFHGAVCRQATAQSPTRVRVERIGDGGVVTATASRSLATRDRRQGGCSYYDVTTDWKLGATEHVRICASRGGGACPASPAGT